MEKQEREEFQKKLDAEKARADALDVQVKEFNDQKAALEAAKVKAESDAADEKLRSEIKEFLAANGKNLKIIDELNVPELMFQVAKAQGAIEFKNGDKTETKSLRTVFEDFIKGLPTVQLGESKEFQKQEESPKGVIELADKYVADHPKEFSKMEKAVARSKALQLYFANKIKFN